ncbi:hypothetical protein LIA77_11161 [Sarocladium implicatum]|nr:hypothetical protein LIA77_11161 [Sarocladium implicatum]
MFLTCDRTRPAGFVISERHCQGFRLHGWPFSLFSYRYARVSFALIHASLLVGRPSPARRLSWLICSSPAHWRGLIPPSHTASTHLTKLHCFSPHNQNPSFATPFPLLLGSRDASARLPSILYQLPPLFFLAQSR